MRAPGFWFNPPRRPGMRARLLAPLGALYAYGTRRRLNSGHPYRARVPVLCVGNLNAGGTGKTPTVIALLQHFAGRGFHPHVVSRGHGGRATGPLRVDATRHDAAQVGDEPLLLAAFAPVWVARDRAAGVRAAEQAGADLVLLDDGFQNPSLVKDFSLVVVDAARGFGNGRCIPAGPLREPVGRGLARADALLSIGDDAAQAAFLARWGGALGPIAHLRGRLLPLRTGMTWRGVRVLAFAGIGDPAKFFASLAGEGADLVRTEPLSDHQPLAPALLNRLAAEAAALDARLVTTEKDATRLPPAFRGQVLTFAVRLAVDDWGPIADFPQDSRVPATGRDDAMIE